MNKSEKGWFIIIGVLYLIMGGISFFDPFTTLGVLIILLGVSMVVSGGILLFGAKRAIFQTPAARAFEGILIIIIGLIFLFGNMVASGIFLSYMLLGWFIVTSVINLLSLKLLPPSGLKIFLGILNIFVIIASIYLLFRPLGASLLLAYTVSFLFIIFGMNRLIIAFSN